MILAGSLFSLVAKYSVTNFISYFIANYCRAQCGNFKLFLHIIHSLRESNFWDSRSANSAILTHLETLNLDFFMNFCTFQR